MRFADDDGIAQQDSIEGGLKPMSIENRGGHSESEVEWPRNAAQSDSPSTSRRGTGGVSTQKTTDTKAGR
jgi:hypothetical protein